ncbi:MAG: hypothetical protein JGK24_20455 [Microcoleus sp. PH2017_29_MFU_D_A]|jgi:hypothetical protein|uniref:hypothetical protein n=1 Tax=unclassified Microcoleus TaxID=2642155 RepID=UPI001D78EECB|nr:MULTISPECIES: hypothetical protein [unclassified Microcoleus]MCC3605534.1 hypothetical protein [Microcoleus sp. PH2017_29_MFU_D_A]MCC3638671.1 hypothetical protein [Microcoleus sp. PH2017_37_MFU_D_B]
MPSENQDLPKTQTPNNPKLPIPSDILLSLAALPMLGGLLVAKAAAEFVSSIGIESEEVFRGSRLPVLNFPQSQE